MEYYQVGHDLSVDLSDLRQILSSKKIDGFLLVNYFGFSYDIDSLKELLNEFNVFLVEDNAHGFGSLDPKKISLGLRGDYGIFSFRKSYPMMNGALLTSRKALASKMKQDFATPPVKRKFFKRMAGLAVQIIGAAQFVSWIKKARQSAESKHAGEFGLDQPIDFYAELSDLDLRKNDENKKDLYGGLLERSKELGMNPLFPVLPEGVVPYCFPFSPGEEITLIEKKLNDMGMEIFHWPDFTEESRENLDSYFLNIWAVRLIW